MTSHQQPKVGVFSLGGTIAMTPQPGGGVGPALSAAELLAAVPGVADTGITVDVHDFRRVPGASLSFPDLLALAHVLGHQADSGVDGLVITQGTDTIEETAYLLDLLHTSDVPVVVTGAMRSATAAGADGPANLLSALRVAASTQAWGLGCLVAFADEIHTARHVRKTHATSITAFTSRPGPIGYVLEDQVHIPLRPERGLTVTGVDPSRRPRTAVVPAVLGDDGVLLATIAGHIEGLVVAGFGAGHVPESWVPVLTDLAARLPVVLASRTGAGSVLSHTYGFSGSESDLIARGLISARSLDAYKARILLHLLLAAGGDRDEIRAAFAAEGQRTAAPAVVRRPSR